LYAIRIELVSASPDFDLESLFSHLAFLQFGLKAKGFMAILKRYSFKPFVERLDKVDELLSRDLHCTRGGL
jgi:hypothetical protein